MPDGTGLDLVRQIRERQPVRAIALSGFGMEEDIRRSLDNGFVDHLVKPVSQQRLFEAISRALEGETGRLRDGRDGGTGGTRERP
jgi:CheY-like chemotaxis protein